MAEAKVMQGVEERMSAVLAGHVKGRARVLSSLRSTSGPLPEMHRAPSSAGLTGSGKSWEGFVRSGERVGLERAYLPGISAARLSASSRDDDEVIPPSG